MSAVLLGRAWALTIACLGLAACDPASRPQTGGQTNWLRVCITDSDCGELQCVCGSCTRVCDTNAGCSELDASCVTAGDSRAIAFCSGMVPSCPGLCLQSCDEGKCPTGTSCLAGVCTPIVQPTHRVAIDTTVRYQELVGFGASVAFLGNEMVAHPDKEALFDAMFADSGFEIVRLRNRYSADNPDELNAPSEIIAAATDRLGFAPMTLLSSSSPPEALKANGSRECDGDPASCTLIQTTGGGFDYVGFAEFWSASIEAYSSVGIPLDFVSIQNHPNWVPPSSDPKEACLFLASEGTTTIEGEQVNLPGYSEALEAVSDEIGSPSLGPQFVAPEVSGVDVAAQYVNASNLDSVGALATGFYGMSASDVDTDALVALKELAQDHQLPLFQTEMRSDGFDTAVLMHYALTQAEVSVYLQNDFAVSASSLEGDSTALIALEEESFSTRLPYHAMRHFAAYTSRGWRRVDANVDSDVLLASAWIAPQEDALTVVLVNVGLTVMSVDLSDTLGAFQTHEVVRTSFEGVERSAELGALPSDGVVRVPGHSVITVAFHE